MRINKNYVQCLLYKRGCPEKWAETKKKRFNNGPLKFTYKNGIIRYAFLSDTVYIPLRFCPVCLPLVGSASFHDLTDQDVLTVYRTDFIHIYHVIKWLLSKVGYFIR